MRKFCISSKFIDTISFFFFQAEDGIRDIGVTGVQTCALPICKSGGKRLQDPCSEYAGFLQLRPTTPFLVPSDVGAIRRSEEHTSELQSRQYLVCRLLLEKKNILMLVMS